MYKTKICYSIVILLLGFTIVVNGQNNYDDNNLGYHYRLSSNGKAFKNLFVYDIGVSVIKSISKGNHLQAEIGYRSAGRNLKQNWDKYAMNMATDISSLLVGVSYEWFPFVAYESAAAFSSNSKLSQIKNYLLQSLKIRGGIKYIANPDYKFNASLRDDLSWGQMVFTQKEVGTVYTTIQTHALQPFVALGIDRFYNNKKLSVGFEGGALYQGKPIVSMKATNMLEQTSTQATKLEYNIRSCTVMPYLELQMQVKL